MVQGPGHGGDGQVGCHRGEAASAQLLDDRGVGHAAAVPHPPGDRGGAQAAGPATGREGVEVRVGRRVRALPATAPDTGVGGEQDERAHVSDEVVEQRGACRLAVDHVGELVQAGVGERRRAGDTSGVEDGGEVVDAVEHAAEPVAVGRVAGGDGHPGAELFQLGAQVVCAGGVGAPAAGEHQVLGAASGQPAGHVCADRAGATGDQCGAGRRPTGRRCRAAEGGGAQASGVDAVVAYRDLVLVVDAGDGGLEAGERGVVEPGRQVDQRAPAVRLLQAEHPAGGPDLGGPGQWRLVGGGDGDRAAGDDPEPSGDPGVGQGLDQQHGRGQAGRDGAVGVRGDRQQGSTPEMAGPGRSPRSVVRSGWPGRSSPGRPRR